MTNAVWDWKSQLDTNKTNDVFDCMVAEFLLSYGEGVLTEEKVKARYKVDNLNDLATKQIEKFEKLSELYKLFKEIETPLIRVLWQMEQNGIVLDSKTLLEVGLDLDGAITSAEADLIQVAGEPLNWNSPAQVGTFLAVQQKIPLTKTKTGKWATNENELAKYENDFPIVAKLFKYRELKKLRSTYIDSLIDKIGSDGRVHTTYSQVATATGRLSSINPNLQNIPTNSEYGQRIKACFRADDDKILVSFDYSQQELRILAHLSGELEMIKAFEDKLDVHTATASQLFDVPYEKVSKKSRDIAKTINFGVIYGMGSYGLSNQLQISVEEAADYIDTFNDKYPKIKAYFDAYISNANSKGYAETILGRRRSIYDFPGQKFINSSMRRVLMNYPIQGSAADLMRKAMVMIHKEVLDKDVRCKMLLQIHDDLVFEIDDNRDTIDRFGKKVTDIMCNAYPLAVPVAVEMKVGKKWGEWVI